MEDIIGGRGGCFYNTCIFAAFGDLDTDLGWFWTAFGMSLNLLHSFEQIGGSIP